jgi:amidohydrolase
MTFRDDATALQGDLTQLRNDLHREPEIGLDLPRTQEKVLRALDGLPLEVTTGDALTSVTAVLRGSRPGPTVLLRGDMDALPVTERNGSGVSSQIDGRMHACGHDLHTTMLAGAAQLLSARRDTLAGKVVFMFQPGEEGFRGAKYMLDEGLLAVSGDRPVAAYALHVMSAMIPAGLFFAKSGSALAAADTLRVIVRGAGGHGSAPHRAKDPIPAACEMVTALQTMVTRGFDVFDPIVVTTGNFHAGTADNIIPDEARFDTTIRTFTADAHSRVQEHAVRLIRGIADAYGLEADIDYNVNYPVTVNDSTETDFAADTVREVLGEERFETMPQPLTGAEDFSFVLNEIPGSFVFLGACPADRDPAKAPNNHSPEAAFDDAVLADGATVLAELATRRLDSAATAA